MYIVLHVHTYAYFYTYMCMYLFTLKYVLYMGVYDYTCDTLQ